MPSAGPMVCRLYHTVIHCNAGRVYDSLVVQSCYTNGTCRRPVQWCAGCIILAYCNAGQLYDSLVVQSCYTNGTCGRPVLWCAGCIILSYTPMPAGRMIPWLYNHVIPMSHAVGRSYGVPAV